MTPQDTLPRDAQSILELAARSMFHLFSSISQGMFLVDITGRIVWLNEGYKRFLPALGFSAVVFFQRPMSLALIIIVLAVLILPRVAKRMSERKRLRLAQLDA